MIDIDNRPPTDPNYPTFEPSDWHQGDNLIVAVGEYVVNDDGRIMITTTTNAGSHYSDFLRDMNEPYFRARYIGNRDDSLEFADRCRKATPEEIAVAKKYDDMPKGQVALL